MLWSVVLWLLAALALRSVFTAAFVAGRRAVVTSGSGDGVLLGDDPPGEDDDIASWADQTGAPATKQPGPMRSPWLDLGKSAISFPLRILSDSISALRAADATTVGLALIVYGATAIALSANGDPASWWTGFFLETGVGAFTLGLFERIAAAEG